MNTQQWDTSKKHFLNVAKALVDKVKTSGYTTSGQEKLNFTIDGQKYRAVQHGTNRSQVLIQEHQGTPPHFEVIGECDLSNGNIKYIQADPQPLDIKEIEKALSASAGTTR